MLSTIPDKTLSSKVKMENILITKQHIQAHLKKRYDHRQVEIIMGVIKFPLVNSYEDHWKHLDKFISGETKIKKKLGFLLHDINGDGRICPNDNFDLT